MLEVDKERVTSKVEEGAYYHEARSWYHLLYHSPIAERSYYIIITFVAVITIFVSIETYEALFPLKPAVPFVIETEGLYEDMPRMRRLAADEESPDIALKRYFLEYYVESREYYEPNQQILEENFYAVRGLSTPEEFNEYNQYMNSEQGPLLRYDQSTKRLVSVYNVQFDEQRPDRAYVGFRVTLSNEKGVTSSFWLADITFQYKKIEVERNSQTGKLDIEPMEFKVIDYQVKEQRPAS